MEQQEVAATATPPEVEGVSLAPSVNALEQGSEGPKLSKRQQKKMRLYALSKEKKKYQRQQRKLR
jgi:hypothetical protein